MDRATIPPEAQALLRDTVTSHEHLKVLMLVFSHKEQRWTPGAVARSLSLPSHVVAETLDHLSQHGLLRILGEGQQASFAYDPGSPQLASAADALALAYESNRSGVMSVMNFHAVERVRAAAMRLFADAFILGGKKGKDG